MTKGSRRLVLCGVAVLALAGSVGARAQQKELASIEARLGAVLSYYLRDGGVWRQEDASHEPGSGSPVAYVKRYQWGPGRTTVLDDTFALKEDGSCDQWTHNVFHWDHREGRVRGQLFHFSGAWFSGLISKAGEHENAAEFSGVLPDGTELAMRDTTDLSDPNEAVVTAWIRNGGTWTRADSVSWVRVTSREKPCGL